MLHLNSILNSIWLSIFLLSSLSGLAANAPLWGIPAMVLAGFSLLALIKGAAAPQKAFLKALSFFTLSSLFIAFGLALWQGSIQIQFDLPQKQLYAGLSLFIGVIGMLGMVPFAFWACDLIETLPTKIAQLCLTFLALLAFTIAKALLTGQFWPPPIWQEPLTLFFASLFILTSLLTLVEVHLKRYVTYWCLSQFALLFLLAVLNHTSPQIPLPHLLSLHLIYILMFIHYALRIMAPYEAAGTQKLLTFDLEGIAHKNTFLGFALFLLTLWATPLPGSPGFIPFWGLWQAKSHLFLAGHIPTIILFMAFTLPVASSLRLFLQFKGPPPVKTALLPQTPHLRGGQKTLIIGFGLSLFFLWAFFGYVVLV